MGEGISFLPNGAGTTEYPSRKTKMNLDTNLMPYTKTNWNAPDLNVRDN